KGDLDWVVMKCLEKDRTRRYESASTLAHDVERYLADEPVQACPPSASYRLRRFIRKHKMGLIAAAAFVLLLIAGFVASTLEANREDFCLYLFRGLKEIEKKYLLPPSYMPLYREWDWYKKPIAEQRALWSEPYVDTGGGEIPMVTYSTPIRRGEQVVGVLTLD